MRPDDVCHTSASSSGDRQLRRFQANGNSSTTSGSTPCHSKCPASGAMDAYWTDWWPTTGTAWCGWLTTSSSRAERARRPWPPSTDEAGLHPAKTHLGDCRLPGQGFEFLGYRFEAGRRLVRNKSLAKLKASIRAKTARNRGDSPEVVIADLNPVLRGWCGYFKQAHPATSTALDGFTRRRLRSGWRKPPRPYPPLPTARMGLHVGTKGWLRKRRWLLRRLPPDPQKYPYKNPISRKIESTVRYPGVEIGDALEIAEKIDV